MKFSIVGPFETVCYLCINTKRKKKQKDHEEVHEEAVKNQIFVFTCFILWLLLHDSERQIIR